MQFNIGQESIFIKQDKLDIWDTQVTDLAFRIMQKEPEIIEMFNHIWHYLNLLLVR